MKTIMLSLCLMAVTINANAFSAAHAVVHNSTRNSTSASYDANGIQKLSDTTYVVRIMGTDSLLVFKTPQEAIVFRNKDQARYNEEHKNDGTWLISSIGLFTLIIGFIMHCAACGVPKWLTAKYLEREWRITKYKIENFISKNKD